MDRPAKASGALTEAAIVTAVKAALQKVEGVSAQEARNKQALQLYNFEGLPGDELIARGRSAYVTTQVYNQVEMIASQLLSLFEGQDDVVTFEPREANDVALAQQQTDIVNYFLRSDNELTVFLNDWFKNGLIYGLGIAVAEFYTERKWRPARTLRELPDTDFTQLLTSDDHDVRKVGQPYNLPGDTTGLPLQVRDVEVKEAVTKSGIRLMVLAPENVILSADAKFCYRTGGIDAALQGYKVVIPRRKLVEMGHDRVKVDRIPKATSDTTGVSESRNRYNEGNEDGTSDIEPEVTVYEVFMHLNVDGADHTPLMHLTLAGESGGSLVLLSQEEVEMSPLAAFVPVIDPNTIQGKGIADLVGRDQKFISKMWRATQDNVHSQIYPRAIVRTDAVDMEDVLSDEIGAIIRAEDPSAIQFLQTPFVGGVTLPVIEQVQAAIEERTGLGQNTMALNPEDLKRVTATNGSNRLAASMLRVDKMARLFAGTGYRYLFRVIGSLMASHPDEAAMIAQRLTNSAVQMEPDSWDTGMDVKPNVSFGNTDKPQKNNMLMSILAMQKEAMANGMPCGPQHLYATFAEILNLNGIKNVSKFMDDPAKMPPQPEGAEKPDPEMMKAQAEMQMKFQLRQMELQQEMQIAQMKLDMEERVAMREAELKYAVAQKEMGAEIMLQGARMSMGTEVQTNISNPTK